VTGSSGKRSWDLKVERAEKHLEEVKDQITAYALKHPYRPVRARQPKGKRNIWLYRLEMTEEPDPMIPIIVGECLYGIRSALDHLAVAMAPRSRKGSAAFPVEATDPWKRNDKGAFVYDEERRISFTSKIRGIPADAVAMIKEAQPYRRDRPEVDALALISRLENADKHREPVGMSYGLAKFESQVRFRNHVLAQRSEPGLYEHGAEVAKFDFGFAYRTDPTFRPPPESEVQVEFSGTAAVAIKVAGIEGHFGMPESLEILVAWMRDVAIPELSPFVRKD